MSSKTICCANAMSWAWDGASTSRCHAPAVPMDLAPWSENALPMDFAPWLKIQSNISECTVLARSAKVSQALGKFKPYFCRIGCATFAWFCLSSLGVISIKRVSSA